MFPASYPTSTGSKVHVKDRKLRFQLRCFKGTKFLSRATSLHCMWREQLTSTSLKHSGWQTNSFDDQQSALLLASFCTTGFRWTSNQVPKHTNKGNHGRQRPIVYSKSLQSANKLWCSGCAGDMIYHFIFCCNCKVIQKKERKNNDITWAWKVQGQMASSKIWVAAAKVDHWKKQNQ